jgi:hypothetical protein
VAATAVSTFLAVIDTPGIKAFDGSSTIPPKDAFPVCANKLLANPASSSTANRLFLITSPFF